MIESVCVIPFVTVRAGAFYRVNVTYFLFTELGSRIVQYSMEKLCLEWPDGRVLIYTYVL